jgi:hypothetical protein
MFILSVEENDIGNNLRNKIQQAFEGKIHSGCVSNILSNLEKISTTRQSSISTV